jgi:hypothetical protein
MNTLYVPPYNFARFVCHCSGCMVQQIADDVYINGIQLEKLVKFRKPMRDHLVSGICA